MKYRKYFKPNQKLRIYTKQLLSYLFCLFPKKYVSEVKELLIDYSIGIEFIYKNYFILI